jgi:hypothetical protein
MQANRKNTSHITLTTQNLTHRVLIIKERILHYTGHSLSAQKCGDIQMTYNYKGMLNHGSTFQLKPLW